MGLHTHATSTALTGILRHLVSQGQHGRGGGARREHHARRRRHPHRNRPPAPERTGATLSAQGSFAELSVHPFSITGAYLSGRQTIQAPEKTRPVKVRGTQQKQPLLASRRTRHKAQPPRPQRQHPAGPIRLCSAGVSGSGKSTLLDNVIYQGLLSQSGKSTDNPARVSPASRAIRALARSSSSISHPSRALPAPTLRSTWMHGTRSAASSRALPKPKRQV